MPSSISTLTPPSISHRPIRNFVRTNLRSFLYPESSSSSLPPNVTHNCSSSYLTESPQTLPVLSTSPSSSTSPNISPTPPLESSSTDPPTTIEGDEDFDYCAYYDITGCGNDDNNDDVDDLLGNKVFKYCVNLEETWEINLLTKPHTLRRSKSEKGPKKCTSVNGPRYNKKQIKNERIQQNYEMKKANSALRIGIENSKSTKLLHSSSSSALPCGLTSQQLNDLQNRELTPEDYELLLALDEAVPKKTLSLSSIDTIAIKSTFNTDNNNGECCVVCYSELERGCTIRTLSCGHTFHSDCIVTWLSNSSVNCPIDGLPVS